MFVFCELRGVLLPEFGDLIWRDLRDAKRCVRGRDEKVVARKRARFAAQGKPFEAQGEPLATQGKPFGAQGKHEWRLPSLNCLLRRLFLCST
jgi:hypothetical protein